ncbi:hypothetical protein FB00_01730 [Cellulosimicrobium funkei]|uniref:DUF4245 domain-containing protein n=1 Tax=Cellulosimicrobium funkei TaxID=264251 RepID=A0A0H2L8W6_9MICO|nr:hypothetical protein [Cellulosimicrobium funkei]KLN36597.1 hypothetical protein FB00_01730 [Cellulosimicrobium funkei]
MSADAPGAGPVRPEGWVPVERRLLGLDRSTIAPALAVLALLLVAVVVLPTLNERIARDNPARTGDVIRLGDAVTFSPTPGWNILSGQREDEPGPADRFATSATVSGDGVVLNIQTDTYDGTPQELLDQLRKTGAGLRGEAGYRVAGDPLAVTTDDGLTGVAARFTGTSGSGLVATFVVDDQGIEVVALGPDTTDPVTTADVAAMIQSIAPVEEEATS